MPIRSATLEVTCDYIRYFLKIRARSVPDRFKINVYYKINNTYVPPDGLFWRVSTDCNDNYQKDVDLNQVKRSIKLVRKERLRDLQTELKTLFGS